MKEERDESASAGPASRPFADARLALGRLPGRLFRAARAAAPPSMRRALDGAAASLTGKPRFIRHLDLAAGRLRRRRYPRVLFVGWLLQGDRDDGSSRALGWIPHVELRRMGINSVILWGPRTPAPFTIDQPDIDRIVAAGFDVVVFQGVHGTAAQQLALALRRVGARTIYATGDLFGEDMNGTVDWVVGASEGLTSVAGSRRDRSSVIEAPVESSEHMVKDYSWPGRSDRIRVVWVGYPENLHLLTPVRTALTDPRLSRLELVTISRGPGFTYQWHRTRVWSQLLSCDIAVLPSAETDWYLAKPNTRMVMFKALGIPSVASPLASYVATLTHGRSCYFARTPEGWADALVALTDPAHRREIGLADRERILAQYGREPIGRKWLDLFDRLAARRAG